MVVTDQRYEVTGELTPDATGIYEPIGPFGGKPSYKCTGKDWYLWWAVPPANEWWISFFRGSTDDGWNRLSPNILGDYDPWHYLGIATVTEI